MFLKDKKPKDFLSLEVNTDYGQLQKRQTEVAATLGAEGIEFNSDAPDLSLFEAKQKLEEKRKARLSAILSLGAKGQLPVTKGVDAVKDTQDQTSDLFIDKAVESETLVQKAGLTSARFIRRSAIMASIFDERMKDSDVLSLAGDFVDTIASSTFNSIYDLAAGFLKADPRGSGFSLEEAAKDIRSILYDPNISDVEAEAKLRERINEWADAGLLTDSNILYLSQLLQSIQEGGDGGITEQEKAFSVIDVLLAGVPAATKAASVLRRTYGASKAVGAVAKVTSPAEAAPSALTTGVSQTSGQSVAGAVVRQKKYMEIAKDRIFSPVVDAPKEDVIAEVVKNFEGESKRILDASVFTDETGNQFTRLVVGKRDGSAWATEAAAKKYAQRIGGSVQKVIDEGVVKYQVVKDDYIDPKKFIDTTNVDVLFAGKAISKVTSTRFNTEVRLDNLLKTQETRAQAVVKELQDDYLKYRKKLNKSSIDRIDKVLLALRDNPAFDSYNAYRAEEAFRRSYIRLFGEPPTQNETAFFLRVQELNDLEWYVLADRYLKQALESGEKKIFIRGNEVRAKEVQLPEGEWALDLRTGSPVSKVGKAWLLKNPIQSKRGSKIRYVVNPEEVSRLVHEDVMPYRLGGHRRYSVPSRFFVKASVSGDRITFMGTFTESEAKSAVEQINRILKERTDDVVKANNDWNPDIETWADFEKFMNSQGIDTDVVSEVRYFADGDNEYVDGTFREHFVTPYLTGRKKQPIIGYGGETLEVESPLSVIERSALTAVERQAESKYLWHAITGWLKAAEEHGVIKNRKSIEGLGSFDKFLKAVLDKDKRVSNALENERLTIMRRMQQAREGELVWTRLMGAAAEFAFNKDMRKLKHLFEEAAKGNPLAQLRWLAFNFKLGLFNIKQLWLQASQLLNSAAISSSTIGTVEATRAVAGVPLLRMLLVKGLAPKAKSAIAKALAKEAGFTEKEVLDLVEWIKFNGRHVIDKTLIETNNASGPIVPNAFKSFIDAGQMFFREGELSSRLGAVLLSYKELKKAVGPVDIFDEEITRKLVGRQDVFIASMTRASAAQWQKSDIGATAMQFTSYTLRMYEQLFSGRILTKQERLRLGLAQLLFWGLAGYVPLQYADLGMELYGPDEEAAKELYQHIRYGAIDYILSNILKTDTDVASVAAPYSGGVERLVQFLKGSWGEVLGPSISIGLESAKPLLSFTKHVVAGDIDYTKHDVVEFARNVSSFDYATRAWMAFKYGELRSKRTGGLVVNDLDAMDAILLAFGIPLEKVNDAYRLVQTDKMIREHQVKIKKEIEKKLYIASKELEDGNIETFNKVTEDIGVLLDMLPIRQRDNVIIEALRRMETPLTSSLVQKLVRDGRFEIAMRFNNG